MPNCQKAALRNSVMPVVTLCGLLCVLFAFSRPGIRRIYEARRLLPIRKSFQ